MASKITFEITTPERIVYKDAVDQITIPTAEGEITVLPNHTPLVAMLVPGALTVKKNGEEVYMATSGGFIEVQKDNKVIVLADTAERSEELDIKAIEEAKERARKILAEKRNVDDVAFADAAAMLERELARLRVARKHRSGRSQHIVSE